MLWILRFIKSHDCLCNWTLLNSVHWYVYKSFEWLLKKSLIGWAVDETTSCNTLEYSTYLHVFLLLLWVHHVMAVEFVLLHAPTQSNHHGDPISTFPRPGYQINQYNVHLVTIDILYNLYFKNHLIANEFWEMTGEWKAAITFLLSLFWRTSVPGEPYLVHVGGSLSQGWRLDLRDIVRWLLSHYSVADLS